MDEVKKFISALQGLGDFDSAHYSKRLQKASQSTPCLGYFQYQSPDVAQSGTLFDNQDCQDLVNILAASSIARCLANVSEDYGFQDSVNTDKAVELSKKTIASLLTSMYGDHVNNHLRSNGVRTLHELHNDGEFFNNYHKLLLSPPFDHNALSRNVGRNYTIALLYCYEYLKHGPGFDMTEVISTESEDMNTWVTIFKTWVAQSQAEDFRKANPDFKVEQLLPSVGGVLALHGYPDATTRDIAEHLKDQIVGDALMWDIADDVSQLEILGQNVWASWDSATYDYQAAIVRAVNDSRTEYSTPNYAIALPLSTEVKTTFGEAVDQYMGQLSESYTRNNPLRPLHKPVGNTLTQPATEHLHRQWELQDNGDRESVRSDIPLPIVSTCEGVVSVNGVYCSAASVKGKIIAWSREIPGLGWEHGYFKLDLDLMIGQGRVYYGATFDSLDETKPRQFAAYPTANTLPPKLVSENMITDRKARRLLGDDIGPSSIPLYKASSFSAVEVEAEVGTRISPLVKASDSESQFAKMSVTAAAAAVADKWNLIDIYTLSYDTAAWSDTDASVRAPAACFDVATAFYSEGKVSSCRIPVLDRIRDAAYANAQMQGAFTSIEEFYTCFRYLSPTTHNTVFEFRCNHPELIAQQADNWNAASPKYENLTFNNIGLPDVKLPFVFSVMDIELSWDALDVTGIVRRYDPKMVGEQGKRHRILGSWSDTPVSLMSVAHTSVTPQLFNLMTTSTPVPTDESLGAKELSQMTMPAELHEETQNLIYRVMLYHMSESDRNKFVGVVRPPIGDYEADGVPSALGPNCEDGLRRWIEEKYIPAWLTQRISDIGDTSKEAFRRQLSTTQRKKLKYWWQGKGPGCMSKDDYYNRLNETAAQYTLLRLLERLRDFKSDPSNGTTAASATKLDTKSLKGGKRWATALYNSYNGPTLRNLVDNMKGTLTSGYNPLQALGNILQALDPIPVAVSSASWTDENSPLCIRLVDKVRRSLDTDGCQLPYVGNFDNQFIGDEYQFLYDAMNQLWINLMKGTPGFDGEILKKAAEKAELALQILQAMLKSASVFAKANKDFAIGERIGEAWAGFRGRGAVGAVALADYSTQAELDTIKDEMKASRLKTFAYSSMVVVSVQLGMYIGAAVTAFKGWDKLETGDRTTLVLGAIQQAVYTLKSGGEAFKLILDFKADKQRFLAAAAAEAATPRDLKTIKNDMRDLFGEEFVDPEMRITEKGAADGKSQPM
ncbi:hypothetical protein ONZ43_g882 [Nemania bipapillata]|uniref:Uncharacterized protein n=1 Tax=Nemania bipapillata TaxID=110536 RepID=A0ACC2J6L7_9PEZI|nr:hypothetical protein ONZ43_g882 [Nemania bipapillata]